VFWVALTGVFLTALYVGRMLFMTFSGEYRGGEKPEHGDHDTSTPHESPILMTAPLVILAILAATVGFVNIDDGVKTLVEGWLPHETEELVAHSSFELWIALASTAAGAAGLTVAWAVYYARIFDSEKIAAFLAPLPEILAAKYYMDILYEDVIVKLGLMRGTAYALSLWDKYVVDGAVNGVAVVTGLTSDGLRRAQVGQVQVYGAAMFLGLFAAVAGILIINPP
jgi:NADH-quinone oxidoreductase subunit L